MMAYVIINISGMLGVADNIAVIMESDPTIYKMTGDKLPDEKVTGEIELENVTFSYPCKKDVEVLKGFNLKIDPEKKRVVALCGTSGCGKSSVISVL
jgi:ABC-type multidrug transport system fused ATPase/permease subunit